MIGAFLRHYRRRGERRNGGLANGDDMRIGPHMPDEVDQMLRIIVERETAPASRREWMRGLIQSVT